MKKLLLFVILTLFIACAAQGKTWIKVTLGQGYKNPVQIHIFADHYCAPWYHHYALTRGHVDSGVRPAKAHMKDKLTSGQSTGWLNISKMVYPGKVHGGARLVMYPAMSYYHHANHFNGTIQFATAPKDSAVVKTYHVNRKPSTIVIVVPENLDTPQNIAKLRDDWDFAQQYGKIAANYDWPAIGRKPTKFPFFVAASLNLQTTGHKVINRELKTLEHFGFNGLGSSSYFHKFGFIFKKIGRAGWYYKDTYSAPEMKRIRKRAKANYKKRYANGIRADQITYAMAMDEPTGQKASVLAKDAASIKAFKAWLKGRNLTPADLLVSSWKQVKPVTSKQRKKFPALYYYTQKFRTVALGKFVAIQKKILHHNWKDNFPVVVNFSDGAIYYGNFFGQGVDYFTYLHQTKNNAIWSEDWSNGASTYQCGAYNVALMHAAARKNGQTIGMYLISHYGRKPYDIQLKAVSEAARGVKIFNSFNYGPVWANHAHSLWQSKPDKWKSIAQTVREFGAVEDYLLPAQPKRAETAILYSSSTDIWTLKSNHAYGFNRMNTWLALAHAQIPVDIVSAGAVANGMLQKDGYKVCYFSGPNISRAAALKLRDWVKAGGTLVMTAGAGMRDKFNRPIGIFFNRLLPFKREPVKTYQKFTHYGRHLTRLHPHDEVTTSNGTKIKVLSVKQTFKVSSGTNKARVLAKYADGKPAALSYRVGQGRIICEGFLPSLSYVRKALMARQAVAKRAKKIKKSGGMSSANLPQAVKLLHKSYNPWQYLSGIRRWITSPVHVAGIKPPIKCNTPLIDAVYMTCPQGVLIPLANYTLKPIENLKLNITVNKPVKQVRSVYHGKLSFHTTEQDRIQINLPLNCTDFITVNYKN